MRENGKVARITGNYSVKIYLFPHFTLLLLLQTVDIVKSSKETCSQLVIHQGFYRLWPAKEKFRRLQAVASILWCWFDMENLLGTR